MTDEDVIIVKHRLKQAQEALEDGFYLQKGERTPQGIINRAYYAMFYAALALLQESGNIPSKHTGIISIFDTGFITKNILPKELSRDFHEAFRLRQVSDYKITEEITSQKAHEILEAASRFVESARNYLQSSL
ncbi:MAG: HEPN domain-containing protein [Candidatus Eremiobacteraeota bacterium]|nr:HEPN domain-containing protein [Candidatus Eremiobacteraeota bacterium]